MPEPESTPEQPLATIVAEACTTWEPAAGGGFTSETVSSKFERIIARNVERGYQLQSWQLSTATPHVSAGSVSAAHVIETIVAVFELVDRCAASGHIWEQRMEAGGSAILRCIQCGQHRNKS